MGSDIARKITETGHGVISPREVCRSIIAHVRDTVPYSFNAWGLGVARSQAGRGESCAGKAAEAIASLAAAGIPARFALVTVENAVAAFVWRRLQEDVDAPRGARGCALRLLAALPERVEQVAVEAYLDGRWECYDVSMDTNMETGLRVVGVRSPLESMSRTASYESVEQCLQAVRPVSRPAIGRETLDLLNDQMARTRSAGGVAREAVIVPMNDEQVRAAMAAWRLPALPAALGPLNEDLELLASEVRERLALTGGVTRRDLELSVVDWLYRLVRENIKRGRQWDVSNVLASGRSDCLGYARLLQVLAAAFGISAGFGEVIQDVAGRFVPHAVCVIFLSSGERRFPDPWYGAPNVRHRRFVLQVSGRRGWRCRPLTLRTVQSRKVRGLWREHEAGLSFYVQGNWYQRKGMAPEALRCYDLSLWLYPHNPRVMFNRAVLLETMGQRKLAEEEYRKAMTGKDSLVRLLASIEGVEPLMRLDDLEIAEPDQTVYLARKGFITGRSELWRDVSRRCGVPESEVRGRYRRVEDMLAAGQALRGSP